MRTTCRLLAWTACLAASLSLAADPAPRPTPAPASAPASVASGEIESPLKLLEEEPPPVIPPAPGAAVRPPRTRALIREGAMIVNRVGKLTRAAEGGWWTIADDDVGTLKLLPCKLLESVEDVHAAQPEAEFRLGGEVCRYKGGYYLLLGQAAVISPAGQDRPLLPDPPATTAPAASGPAPADPDPYASAADVAKELLKAPPDNPIIAPILDNGRAGEDKTSVAPAKRPARIGGARMVMHRLGRLAPSSAPGWYAIHFVSDNTVQEPPMRVLPNLNLEQIEAASGGGKAPGAVFHITGDVERYRGVDYILLRNVIRKRDMGQF
jgi:hypothetical protein